MVKAKKVAELSSKPAAPTTERWAQQKSADAEKVTTLEKTQTAKSIGQDAEPAVPKATAAWSPDYSRAQEKSIINLATFCAFCLQGNSYISELSSKAAAQTTEPRAQQKSADAEKIMALEKAQWEKTQWENVMALEWTRTAKLIGQHAEPAVPKATAANQTVVKTSTTTADQTVVKAEKVAELSSKPAAPATEPRAQQKSADAVKVTTLEKTQTAKSIGQDAEPAVPKATAANQTVVKTLTTAADQTVVKAKKDAELSSKLAAPTTEPRAQQKSADAEKVTTLEKTQTAKLFGQDAEPAVPKATAANQTVVKTATTAADQTVVNATNGAELS